MGLPTFMLVGSVAPESLDAPGHLSELSTHELYSWATLAILEVVDKLGKGFIGVGVKAFGLVVQVKVNIAEFHFHI